VAGGVVSAGTLAYFFQGDFLRGQWLWRTDETQQGTFAQPLPALPVTHLAPVGESLFVVFLDYAYHFSLWRTSDDGRALVRLHEDVGFWVDGPQSLVAVGSALFLSAYDVAHGQELWRSDGTPEGTGLLRDLAPGPDGSSPLPVAEIDGVLLFVASDGLHGREIWRSDGTSEGTILLRDVAPGPDSSSPTAQTKIDGVLLFAASDGIHGAEVWRSDGTEEGTILVQDVAVGPVSSNPRGFTASGPRVYFSADDGVHGQEPWVGWRGILTGRPERAIADLGEMVEALPLPNGVESSLLAKLGVAAAAVERGDRVAAARALQAFLRRASPGATDEIVDLATQTLDLLGGERRAVR
jgi:ELWxxDGT repeat protein